MKGVRYNDRTGEFEAVETTEETKPHRFNLVKFIVFLIPSAIFVLSIYAILFIILAVTELNVPSDILRLVLYFTIPTIAYVAYKLERDD